MLVYSRNHAIIHPPVDRDRGIHERAEVCVHVEKETDGGIYVSGAKVAATGSALTNATFVAHHGLIPVQDRNYACVFMVPMNTPGVPLLKGAIAYIVAKVVDTHQTGDHTLFIGEVQYMQGHHGSPLLFYAGSYG